MSTSTQRKCLKGMQKSGKQYGGTKESSGLGEFFLFFVLSLKRIRPQFLQRNHSSLFCTSSCHIGSSAWQSPILLSCYAEKHSPSHYILGSIPRLAHRCPLSQIFFLLHDTPPQTVVEWAGRRHWSDHNFCFWTHFVPQLQVHTAYFSPTVSPAPLWVFSCLTSRGGKG